MDFRPLYQTNRGYQVIAAFHAIAMAKVCALTDGSQNDAVRAALGELSVASYDIAGPRFTKYVFARNESGCEIHIHSRSNFVETWHSIMDAGMEAVTGITGQVFARIGRVATQIYNDVRGRINAGEAVFIGGHGPGGAVAAVLGELLNRDGKNVTQVYKSACPFFCTEQFADNMVVPNYNTRWLTDNAADVPPTILASAMVYQPRTAPLPILRRPGLGFNATNNEEDLGNQYLNYFDRLNESYWIPRVTTMQQLVHSTDCYLYSLWRLFFPAIRNLLIPWRNVLLNTFSRNIDNLASVLQ